MRDPEVRAADVILGFLTWSVVPIDHPIALRRKIVIRMGTTALL